MAPLPDESIDEEEPNSQAARRREHTIRMWQIYRDYVIREDDLHDKRLGNFLLHQAFLFAAAAALLNRIVEDAQKPALASPVSDAFGLVFLILVGSAGLVASWASWNAIKGSDLALKTLRSSWREWKAQKGSKSMQTWDGYVAPASRQGKCDPADKAEFEPYGLPGIDSAGSEEVRQFANRIPSDAKHIPVTFMVLWGVFIVLMAVFIFWLLIRQTASVPSADRAVPPVTVYQNEYSTPPDPPAKPSPRAAPRRRSAASKP